MGDNMTTEQEKLIEALFTAGSRFMDAKAAFDRCLAIEGTPALKDLAATYGQALDDAMNAHTNIIQSAVRS
jgi:hypothetical protein